MAVKRTRKVQEFVESRVRSGLCLCCEADADKLGLCDRHYTQYYRAKMNHGKAAEQAAFAQEQRRQGRVLAPQEARKILSDNPFQGV